MLVAHDGRVLVTDFGLVGVEHGTDDQASRPAGALGEKLTGDGAVMGTPGYMAPEQLVAGPVDARADQFAFAVTLYRALSRQDPFRGARQGEEPAGQSTRDGSRLPPRPVASWLRALILRGLSHEPSSRYASMDALLEAIERGPMVTWPRVAVALAALVVAGGGVALVVAPRTPDPCAEMDGRLAGVWQDAEKQAVRSAFASTGRAYADDTYRSVASRLDTYTARYAATRTDACMATAVRHEQSAELLDRRMACLDRALVATRAIARLFAAAGDPVVVDRAVGMVEGLPDLSACNDTESLLAAYPPPDPARRARVDEIRGAVQEAAALAAAGKWEQAAADLEPQVTAAETLDYPPLLGEALEERGNALIYTDPRAGKDCLGRAIASYARARDDRGMARSTIGLIRALAEHGDVEAALALETVAAAAVVRAGNAPMLRQTLTGALGHALMEKGSLPEARRMLEASAKLAELAYGHESVAYARVLGNLANVHHQAGDNRASLREIQAAREIFVRLLGPRHFYVARTYENQAITESELEDPAALGHFEDARAILAQVVGADDFTLMQLDTNIAVIWQEQGRYAEVEALMRRLLSALEKKVAPDSSFYVIAVSLLGEALDRQGRRDEATPYLERASGLVGDKGDPETVAVLVVVARAFLERGRLNEACAAAARANAINDKNRTPEDVERASALATLAECERALGNRAEARRLLDRVLALTAAAGQRGIEARGEALFSYARLVGNGPKAVAHARAARETFAQWRDALAAAHIRAIEAWLARRG